MIQVFTKTRHTKKIDKFLNSLNFEHKIVTLKDFSPLKKFDLGVSYCYPRKIVEPLLSTPPKGFFNYHPAPLPKYVGPNELEDAIKNKETHWGVTLHKMDENYDTGKIKKINEFQLHEPPTDPTELGSISHYFLFELFKETIAELYNKKL